MFLAALISRSWCSPQLPQVHSLIPRPAIPFGLLGGFSSHEEQVWVVYFSSISSKTTPAPAHLYSSMVFNINQQASNTDFAIFVLTSAPLFTLPMHIAALSCTNLLDNLFRL